MARATLGYWLTLDRSSLRAELESHQSELRGKQADGRTGRSRPSRKRDQGLEP